MRQFDIKTGRTLGGNAFFIRPFPAFVAANVGGELISLLTPLIGTTTGGGVFNLDSEEAGTVLANGLAGISGDKVEDILKKLLTKYRNITVEIDGREAQILTEDIANEVFCGEAQDMFILATDVIKANYMGFFKSLASRFGNVRPDTLMSKASR